MPEVSRRSFLTAGAVFALSVACRTPEESKPQTQRSSYELIRAALAVSGTDLTTPRDFSIVHKDLRALDTIIPDPVEIDLAQAVNVRRGPGLAFPKVNKSDITSINGQPVTNDSLFVVRNALVDYGDINRIGDTTNNRPWIALFAVVSRGGKEVPTLLYISISQDTQDNGVAVVGDKDYIPNEQVLSRRFYRGENDEPYLDEKNTQKLGPIGRVYVFSTAQVNAIRQAKEQEQMHRRKQ